MYGPLLTDFYQLTMGYAYWKSGLAEKEACFQLFFRKAPFSGQFALACGLQDAIDFLRGLRFRDEDIAYLQKLGFDEKFLAYLSNMRFSCSVDAVAEGTIVFAKEPILRVTGPILQGQLVETPLLNMINFQTLIATKAARVCYAAQGDEVIEFGLRRAHGPDGGLSASRAAYIGGCDSTSNVLAGQRFGIPLRGTMAHSWIMSFPDEQHAFDTYASAWPGACVLMVDTHDSPSGIKNAIKTGNLLRARGQDLLGVRLDSGDLLQLSKVAREELDAAGFAHTKIIASGDLDEYSITDLKKHEAPIDTWGVGTRLVTAHDDPALGGVYKLVAIKDEPNAWRPCAKTSNDSEKSTLPGLLQTRRFLHDGKFVGDCVYGLSSTHTSLGEETDFVDLLKPILKAGQIHADLPTIAQVKANAQRELACLDDRFKTIRQASPYPVEVRS